MTDTSHETPPTGGINRRIDSLKQHQHQLVTSQQVLGLVHGEHAVGRFNSRLAVRITTAVGTMWAAYLFVLIALVSLPQAFAALLNGDTFTAISWLSQSFLQLVLLPIIIVGQNVISASQDARAAADHETLTTLHQINIHQLDILERQEKIMELLQQQSGGSV